MLDDARVLQWCGRLAAPYLTPKTGAVAAFATGDGERSVSYGRMDAVHSEPPGDASLFEIGSITKVFTSLLMVKLALEGRLDLDAPIGTLVPDFAGVPEWITPRSLSTHSSGLPRIPWQLLREDKRNPYARFGEAELLDWMTRYKRRRPPRQPRMSYSNLGVGLLGHVLGRVAGGGWEKVLTREVLVPLGLEDTRTGLEGDRAGRLAQPHDAKGRPTPPWDFLALAGAGALRSTARDLVRFGRHVLDAGQGKGPLHRAIATTLERQDRRDNTYRPRMCLGWMCTADRETGVTYFDHGGGTLGSSSQLFVCPEAGFVLLVLANSGPSLWRELRFIRANPAGLLKEIIEARRKASISKIPGP